MLAAVLLLAAFGAAVTAPAPAAESTRAAAPPSLRQLAKRIVDVGVPGAVVLVSDERGVRAGVAGWGNLRTKERFGPDHRFRIGSVTKSFVATVVLQLVAEGKLSLEDSVERWLPGLVPNGGGITLRHLLNHTSGIYNYTDDSAFQQRLFTNPLERWTPEALIAVATAHRPNFAPGTSWAYSNTGYIVLGLVVEEAAAMPLAEVLQRRIFEPLALGRTSFPTTAALDSPAAHGYELPGNGFFPTPGGKPADVTAWSPSFAWAAGAIASSARDIARFYRALLDGELLARRELETMQRVVVVPRSEFQYGLGIARTTVGCGTAWGHNGGVPGYSTLAVSSPDGAHQAVVLVNATLATSRQVTRTEESLLSAFCR